MKSDAHRFQESSSFNVLSHGDFHASNLILARGQTIGLDLAYACKKPCIYDVVDFLKEDLLVSFTAAEIGAGGIRNSSVEYFFKTYRIPIDRALLNFHLRGRLITSLLNFKKSNANTTADNVSRFDRILHRLQLAFEQNLNE